MSRFTWLALCTLTLLAYTASAQHDDHAHMMGSEKVPAFNATGDEPMSYALYPDQKTYFYLHVAMMVIAFWILMPIGKKKKKNVCCMR
jgi:hypothetical protein